MAEIAEEVDIDCAKAANTLDLPDLLFAVSFDLTAATSPSHLRLKSVEEMGLMEINTTSIFPGLDSKDLQLKSLVFQIEYSFNVVYLSELVVNWVSSICK